MTSFNAESLTIMAIPDFPLPAEYADWLTSLKQRIASTQQRAVTAVNRELVLLYWHLGQQILVRQERQGWGAKVIDRLSHDLIAAFPTMKGFSPRNLKYMRAFAQAWPDGDFVQAVLAQLRRFHDGPLVTKPAPPVDAGLAPLFPTPAHFGSGTMAFLCRSGTA